jgi:hypothetical protein
MSSYSTKFTGPTDESGTDPGENSIAIRANENSIASKAPSRGRRAKRRGETKCLSTTPAGSSKPFAVKGWVHFDGHSKFYSQPSEITDEPLPDRFHTDDESTAAVTAPGRDSVVSKSTFGFAYHEAQKRSDFSPSMAEPSATPEEGSEPSGEVSLTARRSIKSDVTAWIAKSAQRDPPVTLPVTGLFDLLGSEELRVDAALVLQGSAEDGWLEFVKTMGSRYFCPGRDHACSHIMTVPLGGHHILIGMNRAKHDHRLISLLFTVRVRDGINQGSALHGRLLQSKQRQWDSQALQNSAVDWISSVEQPLGKINPGAFEHAKILMNEEMTAGWWIGRTEYSQDAKEQTYTYYGLRVGDVRDFLPSTGYT